MVAALDLAGWHTDLDGRLIWPTFYPAALRSAVLLASAAGWLWILGVAMVWIDRHGQPRTLCRIIVGVVIPAISLLPSFVWLIIGCLLQSVWNSSTSEFDEAPFTPQASQSFALAAMALGIGDGNWLAVAQRVRSVSILGPSSPHLPVLVATGRSLAWSRLGELTRLAGTAVLERLPHLMGALVAIEWLRTDGGLGSRLVAVTMTSRPDSHWILWIAAACFITQGFARSTAWVLGWAIQRSPHQFLVRRGKEPRVTAHRETVKMIVLKTVGQRRSGSTHPTRTDGAIGHGSPANPKTSWPAPPRWWESKWGHCRYQIRRRPGQWAVGLIASATVAATTLGLAGLIAWGETEASTPWLLPGGGHPLGTDAMGVDVITSLWQGFWQMIPGATVAILLSLLAIPLAFMSLHPWLPPGLTRTLIRRLDGIIRTLFHGVESLPKVLILLVALSASASTIVRLPVPGGTVEYDTMLLRFGALLGCLGMPLIHHQSVAVLEGISHRGWLERSLMDSSSGLGWFVTLLRSRVFRVLVPGGAAVLATILYYDAVLGILGVRNRGVTYTWGSTMAMGTESAMAYGDRSWFNPAVPLAPMVALWLSLLCLHWLLRLISVRSGQSDG